ncbi:MAG: type II toxin-antitoxin system Phd/YefM family antitoxin [Actinobacteria bacterium]|nr:MAG: type II toxin-antitoxin system Phd/YefM family antitoxin [Actinomycetota bacterium]RIK04616.1 MAG: type II toxin-antitoxin system prevent-host-death family antitoxin [Acidobacteriota bacterium]
MERTIMASKFKEQCLALLDQVGLDHVPIVITKRGRPVAKLVPVDEVPSGRSTRRSVRLNSEEEADYFSTGEPWEQVG